MTLFTRDKEQDARLDALEAHTRAITEAVAQSQLDIAALHILLMAVQVQVDDKISKDSVDPAINALNEQLGEARAEYDRMSAAAEDSWNTLQAGATDALTTLRTSVQEAADRIQSEIDA